MGGSDPRPHRPNPSPGATEIRLPGKRGCRRRFSFAVVTAALTVVVIEAAAWVTLSVIERAPARWSRIAARRDAVSRADNTDGEGGKSRVTTEDTDQLPPLAVGLTTSHILHPYLGFVEPPDPSLTRAGPRLNSNAAAFGFPHNFHPFFPASPVDRVVVVVVGGSVAQQVAGHGRPIPYLEQALSDLDRFRGRRVHVLNLATGGYKQPQQAMALSYFLALGLPMDVVINIDGFNEVTLPVRDNLPSSVFPFYPRLWNFLLQDIDREERRVRGAVVLLEDARQSLARAAGRRPWQRSFTVGLAWRLLDGSLERMIAERQELLLTWRSGERDLESHGPNASFPSEEELRRELVAVWQRSSQQMASVARGSVVEYYHFLQPSQYDPGAKRLTAEEQRSAFDDSSPFRELVERGYPLLRAAGADLQSHGISFVDLSRDFSSVEETIYIDFCCHLNRIGIRRLVDRIAATVATPLSDSAQPRAVRAWSPQATQVQFEPCP